MSDDMFKARAVQVADEIRTGFEERVNLTMPNASVNTMKPGWSALIDAIGEAIVREVDRRIG